MEIHMKQMKRCVLATAMGLVLATSAQAMPFDKSALSLKVIGQYQTGVFDESAAEIVAHDARNQRIYATNAASATVDVLDINDPANPTKMGEIDVSDIGAEVNSVAVYKNLVAVAIESNPSQAPGSIAFYDATSLTLLKTVPVGALPDMVTFTPNGRFVLVANEGEPSDDYTVDPEGSISIIDLRNGVMHATVATADFRAWNGMEDSLRAQGVRIFGPGASAAQDFEPEYITVSENSQTAWVALQENNALAVVDIKTATVTDILPLGTKDHTLPGNEFDASDRDGMINITNWPTRGMYMPDAIASYSFRGQTYIVTANEGDARDYGGFSEEVRVKDLELDPVAFPNAAELQTDENLGRLKTTTANGDIDGDGKFEEIYSYGARSFSIRSGSGELVYDSGADFENIIAAINPADFNSNNDENDSFDSRSDDKGPEPEGVALGKIGSRTIAFIGLERVGGIMAYDISNPNKVQFLNYINNRDFSVDAEIDGATNPLVGDLGPEGLIFIHASKSPNGKPMLVVANEVSGTTTLFEVEVAVPGKGR
jgi:2',3'-cyclic-nucleotide 2'-phosphodiesterase / 3'-nucleotidase / 5'-nucleotidase